MAATCPFWSGQEISRTAVWRMATPGDPGEMCFRYLNHNCSRHAVGGATGHFCPCEQSNRNMGFSREDQSDRACVRAITSGSVNRASPASRFSHSGFVCSPFPGGSASGFSSFCALQGISELANKLKFNVLIGRVGRYAAAARIQPLPCLFFGRPVR